MEVNGAPKQPGYKLFSKYLFEKKDILYYIKYDLIELLLIEL